MPSKARENRTPTTFWMNENAKAKTKEIAKILETTLTDLINVAVVHYIENIDEINEAYGEKLKMAEVTPLDIKPDEMEKAKKEIRDINERLRRIDLKIADLEDGEVLRDMVKEELKLQVAPVIDEIKTMLEQL